MSMDLSTAPSLGVSAPAFAPGASVPEIEEIYRSRRDVFVRVAVQVTGDPNTGQDVVQEAFARALRQRRSFRRAASVETWLWRVVVNTARDVNRSRADVPVAAIAPGEGEVLHVWFERSDSGERSDRSVTEIWRRDPTHNRLVNVAQGSTTEVAIDGATSSTYDRASNTLTEVNDGDGPRRAAVLCFASVLPAATPTAGTAPPGCPDPLATVRAALDSGAARLDGTSHIEGRPVVRVQIRQDIAERFGGPTTYYVDPSTLTPVRIEVTSGGQGPSTTTDVLAFARLPATAENLRLLDLRSQHPGATIVERSATAP